MRTRTYWVARLVAIVGVGIVSRIAHTGWTIFDKYLGDALYAAMVYAILSLASRAAPWRKAIASMAIMTALEIFQLTMIPAHLLASDKLAVRIFARLLGTEFALRDLLAYAIGIFGIYFSDGPLTRNRRSPLPKTPTA